MSVPGTTISTSRSSSSESGPSGDDDRPVARPDARAVRQQRVVVLHERIRGERHRRHLEPSRARPLVERLDVGEHLLALEAAGVDAAFGERPEHEGVVGVGAVSYADPHEARHASTGFARRGSTTAPRLSG